MLQENSIVRGALVGDAICLGPHWVYDQEEIARKIDRPDQFHDPISQYHPGKKAGDFTHYGDQALLLAEHLAETKHFDLKNFAEVWRAYWENPATISYRDGATRETLANLEAGLPPEKAGSTSHDLAGATRIAPLFLLEWPDEESLLAACRELVAFTHNDPAVIGAAEFFTRVVLTIQQGGSIPEAIDRAGAALTVERLKAWLEDGRKSAGSAEKDSEVLAEHGLSCNIDGGFAGVCHLLLRYPNDPLTAMVENAKAGGDSAARGMLLGMVYGAAGEKFASLPVFSFQFSVFRKREEEVPSEQ
jgi:ADP-ribosylglycohydrolase